ncbi:MAG: hypothetical protein AAFX50_11090, partial [Acidobacteriota bacterium]
GVLDTTETAGHTIRGNSIFSNTGLGIDLATPAGADGATANDSGDGDTGANLFQNWPQLLDATAIDGVLTTSFKVDSAIESSAYPLTVDFYLADGDGEEGAIYLESATYEAADAQSSVRVSFANPGVLVPGDVLVATATDAGGNTSEFSNPVEVNAFLVSTVADSGVGSLRQAITNANAATGESWITFSIPGDGPHVMAPATELPSITQPLMIDGTTQAGNETICSDAIADRSAYQIVLDGSADDAAFGFDALDFLSSASGSTVRGLNIRNFSGGAILLQGSDDVSILCNFVGTDEEGAVAMGNLIGILVVDADDAQIGGARAGDGNLISGHTFPGLGSGVVISRSLVDGTVVQGNVIGTDKAGVEDLGNFAGVRVEVSSLSRITNTLIGGTAEGEGNVFAFNGDGVVVPTDMSEMKIQGNSFYANDGLGIDLQVGGVAGATANDPGDPDDDANRGQNFPVVSADASTGDLRVTYSIDTDIANATYPLTAEFFIADETGAQGETPIGTAEYTAGDYDSCGVAPCEVTVNLGAVADLEVTAGSLVIATATDSDGNTSEFSGSAAVVVGLVDLAVTVVESADPVLAGSGVANLVYTVTVTNDSPVSASGITLDTTLTLPAGVTEVSQVPSAGTFTDPTW